MLPYLYLTTAHCVVLCLQIFKFHVMLHMVQDMLLYGVPMEFDTGSNESHHKTSKQAAKLTQRNEATFNFQTATRLIEFMALDMAMSELNEFRKVWEYFDHAERTVDAAAEEEPNIDDIVTDVRHMSMEGKCQGPDAVTYLRDP